jgi:hypothetical protein
MFEEAKSEALHALDVFEKLGAANDAERTRALLGEIDVRLKEMDPVNRLTMVSPSKQCYSSCALTSVSSGPQNPTDGINA